MPNKANSVRCTRGCVTQSFNIEQQTQNLFLKLSSCLLCTSLRNFFLSLFKVRVQFFLKCTNTLCHLKGKERTKLVASMF